MVGSGAYVYCGVVRSCVRRKGVSWGVQGHVKQVGYV